MQGYYDSSGISSDTFDSAIAFDDTGDPRASEALKTKHIVLRTSVEPTTIYLAFNMLDDTVGGYTPEKQKLRQAISIALDYEEYIEIFLNGRGVASHSPLPPGIFGYEAGESGINPYIYDWDASTNRPVRKSIEAARQLLAEAGYPGGQDSKGNPLIVSFDNTWNSAGATSQLMWMRNKLELARHHDGESNHRLQSFPRQSEKRELPNHLLGLACGLSRCRKFLVPPPRSE